MTRPLPTMSGMGIQPNYPIEKFRNLKGPLLDLRSPKEYKQGHWPGSINVPLFSDKEREEIGTLYKHQGRYKSILLGLKLITPKLTDLQRSLINIKKEYAAKNHENAFIRLYCWRGGMRSSSVAWLANILDLKPALLFGGYKSYRKWALKQFEKRWSVHLIGGKTGSGKTELLLSLAKKGVSIIDLEGLANHRGSSFGSLGLPIQPSNEQYENLIAEELEKFNNNSVDAIWLEDESSNLGRCRVPQAFFKQMKEAPLIETIRSKEERISRLVEVYGDQDGQDLKEATLRITRRLGPQRTAKALEAISQKEWRNACNAILDYYDRCYEHQLSKVKNKGHIDLSGLSPDQAAQMLVDKGLVH